MLSSINISAYEIGNSLPTSATKWDMWLSEFNLSCFFVHVESSTFPNFSHLKNSLHPWADKAQGCVAMSLSSLGFAKCHGGTIRTDALRCHNRMWGCAGRRRLGRSEKKLLHLKLGSVWHEHCVDILQVKCLVFVLKEKRVFLHPLKDTSGCQLLRVAKKNRRWSDHGDDDSRCRIQCFLSIQTCTQLKVVCDTPMLSQNTQKHPKLRGELPVDLFLRRCFFHQHFRSNHKFQRYFSWAKSSHPGWIG